MKKGFTLIEVLFVISIVSVVAIAGTIGYVRITNNQKIKECKNIIKRIETAADVYVETNLNVKRNLINGSVISLPTLQEIGLIEETLKNPINNKPLDGVAKVKISKGIYTYEYYSNTDGTDACK